SYPVLGERRVPLTVVDHFWSLKSTEYWVVSQVTFIVPPPLGLLSTAIASWSAAELAGLPFISTRAKSCFSSYFVPHWPICLFTISVADFSLCGSMNKV